MKRISFLIVFIVSYFFSYSQVYRIEQKTKKDIENIKIEQNMECIEIGSYDHPISFIRCSPHNIIYSSFIVDTVIIFMEYSIRYHFTDTTDYIIIGNISKLEPDSTIPFCPGKELPKDYFKNRMIEFLNSCNFYYVLSKNTINDFGVYYRDPIKFIPQTPPCITY